MTRYDWSAIDKKYKWVAKDSNGLVEAYREHPILGESCWYSSNGSQQLGYSPPWESDSDWEDSLEERPKPASRYHLDPKRWEDSGIKDTTFNRYLTLGEVVDLLDAKERGEG